MAAQNAVLQHLAKAFPRYQPGYTVANPAGMTQWQLFLHDLAAPPKADDSNYLHYTGWGINVAALSPAGADVLAWRSTRLAPRQQRQSDYSGTDQRVYRRSGCPRISGFRRRSAAAIPLGVCRFASHWFDEQDRAELRLRRRAA